MPETQQDRTQRDVQDVQVVRKHQESNTMLAIIMAGIAALFIVAIVVVFTCATGTGTIERAETPPATRTAPQTTGSGSNEPAKEVAPDKSQRQQ